MATRYTVNIDMSQDSANQLSDNGYYLYAFKGVATSAAGGAPLVWFQSDTYGIDTEFWWETNYESYTSTSEIIPNGEIVATNSYPIDLGQTLEVTRDNGTGDVVAGGVPEAISIHNQTTTPFTCGISQSVEGETNQLCAFPLFGLGMNVMVPVEQVLLMFATQTVNTGTVIEKSYSTSFLIDMTGAPDQTRTVSYDINQGWSCGGCTWADQFPPNTELSPILIDSSVAATQEILRLAAQSA